jgi:hypothetical protein
VVGIDLGMMLLALENYASGFIWHLTARIPAIQKGLKQAGFRVVSEDEKQSPLRRL